MKNTYAFSIAASILALFFATTTQAMPMAGETVLMANDWTSPYTMVDSDGITYTSFCLESDKYFTPGHSYTVDSIGDSADGDELSTETKWLYAAFMSKIFKDIKDAGLVVQNAIWHLEDEAAGVEDAWLALKKFTFDDTGWIVSAVNIVSYARDGQKIDNQSQLIGVGPAPVPEPATVLLLGIGLFGLSTRLKKTKRQ